MEANIQKIIRTNWNVTICVSKIARFSSDYSDRGHFFDKSIVSCITNIIMVLQNNEIHLI